MTTEISKTRKIVGWILSALLVALFLFSAVMKFADPSKFDPKLLDWRIIIAIGEIVSAILFLFPRTNLYGVLLLSSYMGGAIMVHMMNGLSIMMPSVVLVLVWIVGFVRNSELLRK